MRYETLKAKEFMGQGEEITILKIVTSGHCGLHDHDFIEFGYVELGKGYHIVGNEGYHIKSGDFFIINANIPHEYKSDQGTPITLTTAFSPKLRLPIINAATLWCGHRYLFHSLFRRWPQNYIKFHSGTRNQAAKICTTNTPQKTDTNNLKSDLKTADFVLHKKDSGPTQSPCVLKGLAQSRST